MEVLILTPFFSPNIGGVETHLDDLVEILNEKKIKGYVLTYQPLMSDAKALKIEMRGTVKIHRVEWFRKLFYLVEPYPALDFLYLTPRLFIATIIFLMKHKNISVIHAQGINAAFIAVALKPIFKKRVVISTHAVYKFPTINLFAKITKWICNRADHILSLLNHSKNELVQLGIQEDKITPYTYWVDQKRFRPADKKCAQQALGWDTNTLHVLFVGRLIEKKGVKELIQATSSFSEKDNICIHIIGTGDLEKYVMKACVIHSINFIGKIPNAELARYFQAADMFIIPSTHEEGAGRVIMEALSCGIPVIGAKRGGIPEILNTEVGELIDVTPNEIYCAIKKVQERLKSGDISQKKCREYAEKKFSKSNANQIVLSYTVNNRHV